MHTPARRLAPNVFLQFDVLPPHGTFGSPDIVPCLCVNAILFFNPYHTFVILFFTLGTKINMYIDNPGDMKTYCCACHMETWHLRPDVGA